MYETVTRVVDQQEWVEEIAGPIQAYVGSIFADSGPLGKSVKNMLNGTWLGHPLHPVITDVPVGAWTSSLVLDMVGATTGDAGIERAADLTLATGLAAAVGAAITGFTDWSDTYGRERKVGLLHGLTMTGTTVLYAASLAARLAGRRRLGIALSNCGLGLLTAGAYLGGDEVFDIGYGVNHTAFDSGPGEFVEVVHESELQDGKPFKGDAQGTPVLLVRTGGTIYALHDTCVHAGCSLAGGKVEGESIICPCHGSQYRLVDGSVINGPATRPEPRFEVRVRDGMVAVKAT